MNCTSDKLKLDYLGNYPVGGDYALSTLDNKITIKALPLIEPADDRENSLEDAEMIFNVVKNDIITTPVTTSDCDFDHTEWTSKQVVNVKLISSEASAKLGITAGEKITFTCAESTDYPNGNRCE